VAAADAACTAGGAPATAAAAGGGDAAAAEAAAGHGRNSWGSRRGRSRCQEGTWPVDPSQR
jgi:hypothetical protein